MGTTNNSGRGETTKAIGCRAVRVCKRLSQGWALPLAVVLAGTVILWFRFNAPPGRVGRLFPWDLTLYYYPMMEYAAERLRAGDLPLWNPHQCCGVPFLATTQVGVFYPGNWLALLMPVGTALNILMFSEVVLGGLFAALFFMALGVSVLPAAIGGLLFVFACVLGQTLWPPQVSTIVWLPFLFLCVEKLVRHPRLVWWAAFTLGLVLQILAGFPQYLVYTMYVLVPYVILRVGHLSLTSECTTSQGIQRAGLLVVGGLSAIGLAGAQLLPSWELVANSTRSEGLLEGDIHYLDRFGFHPPDIPGMVRKAFDSEPHHLPFDWPSGTNYLGIATLFMVVVGVTCRWRNPLVGFFLITAVLTFLLSFGYSGWSEPLYELYGSLPTGALFRTPARFKLLTFFSLIVLAVFGIDEFRSGLEGLRWGRRWSVTAAMIIILTVVSLVLSPPLGKALALIAAIAIAGAFFLGRRHPVAVLFQVFMLVLIGFDLAYATGPDGSLRDIPIRWGQCFQYRKAALVSREQFARVAESAGLNRIYMAGLRPEKTIRPVERAYFLCDYEPLTPQRWVSVNKAMNGLPTAIMFDVDPQKFSGLFDMASVQYVMGPDGPASKLDRDAWDKYVGPNRYRYDTAAPAEAPPDLKLAIFPNVGGLPRAYVVGRYKVCDPKDALAEASSPAFDYRTTVLLEQNPGIASSPAARRCMPAAVVSYEPDRVVLRATAQGDQILVLTDTYFPGWKAYVDGAETEILRANYLFRAIRLPNGTHKVVFEYRPDSFRNGLRLSGSSLLVFLLVCTTWAVRSRRNMRAAGKANPALSEGRRG